MPPTLPTDIRIVGTGTDREVLLAQYPLERMHVAWERMDWEICLIRFWLWAYLCVLVLSVIQLFRFRGRHLGAFLVLVLSLVALGAGLVIALVEIAMNRYSYPSQFVFYLSVVMAPLLWNPLNGRLGCIVQSPTTPAELDAIDRDRRSRS